MFVIARAVCSALAVFTKTVWCISCILVRFEFIMIRRGKEWRWVTVRVYTTGLVHKVLRSFVEEPLDALAGFFYYFLDDVLGHRSSHGEVPPWHEDRDGLFGFVFHGDGHIFVKIYSSLVVVFFVLHFEDEVFGVVWAW